ncbi:MAG: hypothetical protein AAFV53_27205 [Myxococcota bacterium]
MVDEDGVSLCQGDITATVAAGGEFTGQAACGELTLKLTGVVTNTVLDGQIYAYTDDGYTGPRGDLSGDIDEDSLAIVWSLEIPIPTEPPLDDVYTPLTNADGEALLSR